MITRSKAYPTQIVKLILNGYTFTLMDTKTNKFFIYKSAIDSDKDILIFGRGAIKTICGGIEGITTRFTPICHINNHTKELGNAPLEHVSPNVSHIAQMFIIFWSGLIKASIPSNIEIWHPCRCSRCNRPLTDPRSIEWGIGPGCAKIVARAGKPL